MAIQINPVKEKSAKIKRVYDVANERARALAEPMDTLKLNIITGLQGDRARSNPMSPQQVGILNNAEADPRRSQAESLLMAAESIIDDIDNVIDVENDPRWP